MRCNCKLRDMDIVVPANDERAVEVLAAGLPLHHGSTAGSGHFVAKRFGPRAAQRAPNAAVEDGAICRRAPPGQGTEVF